MKLLIRIFWFFIILLALVIGLYPFLYLLVDMSGGFFSQKASELLVSKVWNTAFYGHIIFGGIALLVGWTQFLERIRLKRLKTHRMLGYFYVISVIISGISGGYLAIFATGGIISKLGFSGLALAWLFTTANAFLAVRYRDFDSHGKWMIRSYALTFAAVTLRLLTPILQGIVEMDSLNAYLLVSWLCWVPNLIIAEFIIRSIYKKPSSKKTLADS